ncbi:MAG: hypothetical protein SFX18_03845 [Pirellulales bacterium]|nr:hypothetical protein [Pirellulales bacterium]
MSVHTITSETAQTRWRQGDFTSHQVVSGIIDYSVDKGGELPPRFPEYLTVDVLNLSGRSQVVLPKGLTCYELDLSRTDIASLPDDLKVESRLNLSNCENLEKLPHGLTVGTLILRGCTGLKVLPEGLDVWFLDMTGCWAFEYWPQFARIRTGQLQLRGCTAMQKLPKYLQKLSALNVRDCPNLTSLPTNLCVSGWLELGHSGLTRAEQLPVGCHQSQLRYAGVNVDNRIAFHPETIRVDEVLQETNAERRRVLLDRYGFRRFLINAGADILDRDTDPGGQRELVRLKWEGDEELVALSCFCPSTGRHYMIRVPPTTPTCRHAAAWIAGFDDPDQYRPVLET